MKALAAALSIAAASSSPTMAAPMHYTDFQKLSQPPLSGAIIAYGTEALQHVELWKPAGRGPFPVVIMIHGGCWQTSVANAGIMHMIAADLAKHGIAVWNIEYRGVDVPGGGYPGTFQDVAAAADLLERDGAKLGLDMSRVVAVGHSAGGHLALWLAGRRAIPPTSVLWSGHPLPLAAVLTQAGLPDLPLAKSEAAEACGADTVDKLVGPSTKVHPDPYADTSADRLLPNGVTQTLVSGAKDPIAPPQFAAAWVVKAQAAGDKVESVIVPNAGHFELITPTTAAWSQELSLIEAMLKR